MLTRREQTILLGLMAVFFLGMGVLALQRHALQADIAGIAPEPAQTRVSRAEEPSMPVASAPVSMLSLATATQEDFQALPGIGPKLAAEIVRHREEHGMVSVEDLMQVSGIGPKRFEKIKDRVTLR